MNRNSLPNKACEQKDWDRYDFSRVLLKEFHLPPEVMSKRERKHWEWSMGFLALESLGFLTPDKVGLGIAAGHETIAFALSNHCKKIIATDLYGETRFSSKEAQHEVLNNPGKFSPIPFDPDRISFERMDARDLKYPDDSFDFAFSFSSIEHFGKGDDIIRSMRETYRVLKPGGVYVLSVDWIFKQPLLPLPRSLRWREAGEFMTTAEVKSLILDSTPFTTDLPVMFETDPVTNLYDMLSEKVVKGAHYPHIHIQFFKPPLLRKYCFTSLFLTLFKK